MEKAAHGGNVMAAWYMGQIHNYDTGYYNAEEAFYWYRMAAEKGMGKAMFFTGQAYLFATGVEPDAKKGIAWLERCSHFVDARIRLAQAHRGNFDPAAADSGKAFLQSAGL